MKCHTIAPAEPRSADRAKSRSMRETNLNNEWCSTSARRRTRLHRAVEPTAEELRDRAAEIEAREAELAARATREREYWVGHQRALLDLGMSMPDESGRATFTHAGCVAALLATIASGGQTRDDILGVLRNRYRYSYRHAGFLLTKLTGTDPVEHLWMKNDDRSYGLLSSSLVAADAGMTSATG